jgi:hypothetical protein
MYRVMHFIVAGIICATATGLAKAQVTADDFLPPAKGGPADIKAPEKVQTQGKVVTAAVAQDAMNAAAQQVKKELSANDRTPEIGYRITSFPSGVGIVSVGMAIYDTTLKNRDAILVEKRKAYVKASVEAKSNMVKARKGLISSGSENIHEKLVTIADADKTLNNASLTLDERLEQVAAGLIAGFVTYEVKDDPIPDAPGQRMVYVTLASTPKTAGAAQRTATGAIDSRSLRDGLDQVIQEVQCGVVPPIGGRVVTVKGTGEIAVVGFGSAVVFSDADPAVRAKLKLNAQKIAIMRASDALCGMLTGDAIAWQGGTSDRMKSENKGFEDVPADDAIAKANPAGVQVLEQRRKEFMNRATLTEVFSSARKGVLPPGLSPKSWFDESGDYAYAMCVYLPSATNAAAQLDQALGDNRLLQSAGDGSRQDAGPGGPTTKPVKPGPSGTVSKDIDK